MRTWHFYDETTGEFTRDSVGCQDFKGIEEWLAQNTPPGCKAFESTQADVRGKRIDLSTGLLTAPSQGGSPAG
jgi:hypothetical protein